MSSTQLHYYYLKCLIASRDWRDAHALLVHWLTIIASALAILAWLALAWRGLNLSTWGDEKTTYNMISGSWSDLTTQLENDYHPPGFYAAIKLWWTLSHTLFPQTPFALAAKLFCYLPSLLLAGCGALFFYKRTQKKWPAFIWTWWTLTGPLFLPYGFEIRMYSWAAAGVSLTFLAALQVREHDHAQWWTCLVGASLLALYSQYYAGVSTVLIWLWLYADNRCHHKKATNWRSHWWRTGWITAIAYLPALYFLNNQVPRLSEHPLGTQTFPLSLSSSWHFWGALVTPNGLAPPISSHLYGWSWWSALALAIVLVAFTQLRSARWSAIRLSGVSVYVLTLLLGLIGYTYNIPFMPRYLFPAAGPLLIALISCLDYDWYQAHTRQWLAGTILSIGMLILGCISIFQFSQAEYAYSTDTRDYQKLLATQLSKPEALSIVDATWLCQIDDQYYDHPTDNLNCLSFDDDSFDKQFETALAGKKYLYVTNYFYSCADVKARFENLLGKTSQRVFFSPLLSTHCSYDDDLCEWELVSPQCIYLFELETENQSS